MSAHPSQPQPSNNQEAPSEIEEETTHPLKQERALHKVSSKTRKPPLKKYEGFFVIRLDLTHLSVLHLNIQNMSNKLLYIDLVLK
jgi:hypothetical protein